MCTAISLKIKDHYFGRNLDYFHTFGEKVTITPRNYTFNFKHREAISSHFAIIGMALPQDNYPLYFDATNEAGLSMAGLNFPENAVYRDFFPGKENIASFELIPYILSECKSTDDALALLKKINITNDYFSTDFPPTPLHWIISDKNKSLTLEQTYKGLTIYENPFGVLTNNPPFDIQSFNINNYMSLSANSPDNTFSENLALNTYSAGLGGLGLPGDFSSMSRFVKASFLKLNSICADTENEAINQFFNILYSVYQIRGCVKTKEGYEITNYSSCCNTDKRIYYLTTYNDKNIKSYDLYKEDIDSSTLIVYDF